MFDLIKKTMLTGIGLALKTKDEVENLAEDLIKQGKLSETEGKKFLEEIKGKYEDSQKKLEQRVEKTVKELLKKGNLVTSDELNALKKEIRELKKAVSEKA
jgi:polyhydroxyalkanoate synthesis regulator phasin